MKLIIKHQTKGRIRLHIDGNSLSNADADSLYIFISSISTVDKVKIYDRTNDIVIFYKESLVPILDKLSCLNLSMINYSKDEIEQLGRNKDNVYIDRLTWHFLRRFIYKNFIPMPIGNLLLMINAFRYIRQGLLCLKNKKIEVPVLDATAISISIFRRDFGTAANIMFLLGLGEILEDWTRKNQ